MNVQPVLQLLSIQANQTGSFWYKINPYLIDFLLKQ